jgi:hypothetical protein
MAIAKIKFTNLETKKTQSMQKRFSSQDDAENWLNNFNVSHIKIHNQKVISGIKEIDIKLRKARRLM